MKTYLILWVAVISMLPGALFAQGFGRETAHEPLLWTLFLPSVRVNDRWQVECEIHNRWADDKMSRQNLLIRPLVSYFLKNGVQFTTGYTYVETYPYGSYPVAMTMPQHQWCEQVMFRHSIGKINLAHRYRLEQLWTGQSALHADGSRYIKDYQFGQRFRYRLAGTRDITKKLFASCWDEILLNVDPGFGVTGINQNWIFLGLGYRLTKEWSVQAGYFNTWQPKGANAVTGVQRYEGNHGASIGVFYALSVHTKSKATPRDE